MARLTDAQITTTLTAAPVESISPADLLSIVQEEATPDIPAHNPAMAYQAGDLVWQANKAYRCKAGIAPKAFAASEWDDIAPAPAAAAAAAWKALTTIAPGSGSPPSTPFPMATEPVRYKVVGQDKIVTQGYAHVNPDSLHLFTMADSADFPTQVLRGIITTHRQATGNSASGRNLDDRTAAAFAILNTSGEIHLVDPDPSGLGLWTSADSFQVNTTLEGEALQNPTASKASRRIAVILTGGFFS